MSNPTIQDDPFYETLLQEYYSGGPYTAVTAQAYQDAIDQRFEQITGLSKSSPSTPQTQQEYEAIVQQYHAWSFELPVLQSSNTLASASNPTFYANYLSSNYSITNTTEQNDLWNAFLYDQGYVDSSGHIYNPPDSSALQTAFTNFITVLKTRDSYYLDVFKTYFSGGSSLSDLPLYQAKLWDRFCFTTNNEYADPSDPTVLAAFKAFVSLYSSWGTNITVLESTNSLPDPSNPLYTFFTNYLSAFYGNLNTIQQTDLWNAYLYNSGFVDSQGKIYTPTDPAVVQKMYATFATYVKGLLSNQYYYSATTGQTPFESVSRVILNSSLNSLVTMLNATQDIVRTQAYSLMYYGQLQQAYTQMMARVPTITGIQNPATDPNTTIQIPAGDDPTQWDLGSFTLGYNLISVKEFISYAVEQTYTDPVNRSVTLNITDSSGNKTSGTFTVSYDPSSHVFSYSYTAPPTGSLQSPATYSGTLATTDAQGNPIIVYNADGSIRQPAYQDMSDWAATLAGSTGFEALIKQALQKQGDLLDFYRGKYGNPPAGWPGRYTSMDASANSTDVTNRLQQNAILEQMSQNIKAKRDIVTSFISKLQTSLSNTQQSINQICDVWTTILTGIDTVIKAVFGIKTS